MKILLDTNRYSDLDRGDQVVARELAHADEVFLSFISLAELHAGFRNGSKRVENESRLKRFLSQPGTSVLYPSRETVDHFADLRVQLRRQGTTIPDHDIWIAALAIQHRLRLYARDKHFDCLPQLTRI